MSSQIQTNLINLFKDKPGTERRNLLLDIGKEVAKSDHRYDSFIEYLKKLDITYRKFPQYDGLHPENFISLYYVSMV